MMICVFHLNLHVDDVLSFREQAVRLGAVEVVQGSKEELLRLRSRVHLRSTILATC